MNSLLRSTPLIINLPADHEVASQEYFRQCLDENQAGFLEAAIIAERLAGVPSIVGSSRPIYVAVSSDSVIIGTSLAQLAQWADQFSEGEPYWFFSLRGEHAVPCVLNSFSTLLPPPIKETVKETKVAAPPYSPSGQAEIFIGALDSSQKEGIELPAKPTAKAYYLSSLRKLFHRVNFANVKEVLKDFMSEVEEDSFYFDPEQRKALAKAFNSIQVTLESRTPVKEA